jgi:hypothetical protein
MNMRRHFFCIDSVAYWKLAVEKIEYIQKALTWYYKLINKSNVGL